MANALEAASLVMIPSGYEDGTLGSLKPLDGSGDFTFSRGSDISATRVNEDGYIEKGYENLLTYSNDFSQSDWTKFNASVTSGQSGYDGSPDAWLLNITTSQNSSLYRSISMSGVYTTSVYAKANSVDYLGLRDYSLSGAGNWFNLSNGTIASTTSDCIDAKIESLGNGWYRCSITQNRTTTGYTQIGASDNPSTTSTTSGSIYIQDAMLNQGLVAYPYVETTTAPVAGGILEDMPRLDYLNSSCPSLLLEPQRTNIAKNDLGFNGFGGCTIASEVTTNPFGDTTDVFSATFTSTGGFRLNDSPPLVSGTTYCMGHFMKFNNSAITITASGASSSTLSASGSFSFDASGSPSKIGDVYFIEYPNGWYYVYALTNAISNGGTRVNWSESSGSILVCKSQYEAGSYPTSYIPTYGTSQTRLGENASNSVVNTTSRTYFLDGKRLADASFQTSSNFYGPNDALGITFWNVNRIRFRFGGGLNSYYTLVGDDFKIAISYDGTDSKVFVNGVYFTTQTLDLGNLTSIIISGNNGAVSYNQTLLFPTALSDDECIELTTI